MERRGRKEGEREVRMIEKEQQQEIVELERIYGRERGREVNACGVDSLICCKRFEHAWVNIGLFQFSSKISVTLVSVLFTPPLVNPIYQQLSR